ILGRSYSHGGGDVHRRPAWICREDNVPRAIEFDDVSIFRTSKLCLPRMANRKIRGIRITDNDEVACAVRRDRSRIFGILSAKLFGEQEIPVWIEFGDYSI